MTIEMVVLTVALAAALLTMRHSHQKVRSVWAQAVWWEKLLLAGLLLPIPGPFEDLLGAWVLIRVARRLRAQEN